MTASPLEGFDSASWVCLQRTLVVRDIFTGGKRTFFSQSDAQDFRRRIYARNGDPSSTQAPSRKMYMQRYTFPGECSVHRLVTQVVMPAASLLYAFDRA